MAFERPKNVLTEETPARFAGGRLSHAAETEYIRAPLERTPLLRDVAVQNEFANSELKAPGAALEHAAKPQEKPQLAKGEKPKADPQKQSLVARLLETLFIKSPWLPWRKPKTPEAQEAMEKEHETFLFQTGMSAALVGAVDLGVFVLSHGTIPPMKFISAVALLVSMMYLSSFKKKPEESESKTFISKGFEKNVFGKPWFPWAWGKPRTPEKQAKMQEQHKEYAMSMASTAPVLFLMAMATPAFTAVRIAWALGTMAVMFAFAPLKKEAPRVFKSDKLENFFFGRIPLPFRKPQTPEKQAKEIAETKELALLTTIVGASAWPARAVGVIPMTPFAWFIPAFPVIMKWVIAPLMNIIRAPYPVESPPKVKKGEKAPRASLWSVLENIIFGRAPLPFQKPETPGKQAQSVRETKRMVLLPLTAGIITSVLYTAGVVSAPFLYIIPTAVLILLPLVMKFVVTPLMKAVAEAKAKQNAQKAAKAPNPAQKRIAS